MKKIIKVKFINGCGIGSALNAIKKKYKLVLSDNPDYLFCGPFTQSQNSENPCDYPTAIRIFITGEAIFPDMNIYDYAVGFDDFSFGDRYLRFPLWISSAGSKITNLLKPKKLTKKDLKSKKFCNFLYSNAKAHPMRDKFFYALSKYKKVDSAGRHLKNVSYNVPNKIEWQEGYKFTIACENALYSGYTTEKMTDAFLSKTIPIYFGNPNVVKEFNSKAFINVHNFKNLKELVSFVKKIDQNDKLFLKMLNESALLKKPKNNQNIYEKFILNILEQPLEKTHRRPKGMFIDRYNSAFLDAWQSTHPNNFSLKWIINAKMNKRIIFIQFLGIKIILTDLIVGVKKLIKLGFVIRFKRFETVIKLFGITFIKK